MKAFLSVCAVGLLLLTAQGKIQAQSNVAPLVRNDGTAGISNLKFTGDVQTDDIRWRRYGWYGYGYRGYYGYGYAYSPYYYGYYGNPYYYTAAPYYGYYGGYPYYRGYRRIDMNGAPAQVTNLGTAPQAAMANMVVAKSSVQGPIRMTEYAPNSLSPDGRSVGVLSNGSTAAPDRSYYYDGGPKSMVPLPSRGYQQNNNPVPNVNPERPAVPRDGLPISSPRGWAGQVTPIFSPVGATQASTTTAVGQGSTRIVYPAFGDPR